MKRLKKMNCNPTKFSIISWGFHWHFTPIVEIHKHTPFTSGTKFFPKIVNGRNSPRHHCVVVLIKRDLQSPDKRGRGLFLAPPPPMARSFFAPAALFAPRPARRTAHTGTRGPMRVSSVRVVLPCRCRSLPVAPVGRLVPPPPAAATHFDGHYCYYSPRRTDVASWSITRASSTRRREPADRRAVRETDVCFSLFFRRFSPFSRARRTPRRHSSEVRPYQAGPSSRARP